MKEIDIKDATLPDERTLGVIWKTGSDCFGVVTSGEENSPTRRGMLSTTASLFDPLGLVAPFIVSAKIMIQQATKQRLSWDEVLQRENLISWNQWLADLRKLQAFELPRSFTPAAFTNVSYYELHHFSDASLKAYGVATYVRVVAITGEIFCTLLMSKCRVAPIKSVTVPRLELMAATLAVKQNAVCQRELNIKPLKPAKYWTDSMVVLGYIQSVNRRYQTFVSNRLATIQSLSSAEQWHYIASEHNPADMVSRGVAADCLVTSNLWKRGPEIIWTREENWPKSSDIVPEIPWEHEKCIMKSKPVYCVQIEKKHPLDKLISYFSSWLRLRKAVAWLRRIAMLYNKSTDQIKGRPLITELQTAEKMIIIHVQNKSFNAEKNSLSKAAAVKLKSPLRKLSPYIDTEGVVRVGGRLVNAPIAHETRHPVILPAKSRVSDLIATNYHQKLGHVGQEHLLATLREMYWLIGGRATIRSLINKCVVCKMRSARPCSQLMGNLPADRVSPGEPAFTYTGLDYFGPFEVKRARSVVKKLGCLFTCLTTRAVHIEVADSLEADAFLLALQRFIARRGRPRLVRSDNGSNFVGAVGEMKAAMSRWNDSNKFNAYLQQSNIQWITNPPAASHMGGVFEREIRSVRSILYALTREQRMAEDTIYTLMCNAESIINSKPLTIVAGDDGNYEAITPNHLLMNKAGYVKPMDTLVKEDMYKKRWKQAQYASDIFWKRWVKHYLPTLQIRSKWQVQKVNLKPGDVVMTLDEKTPRGHWPLAKILEVYRGSDGCIRSVKVKTARSELVRPIHKLCLIESPPGPEGE